MPLSDLPIAPEADTGAVVTTPLPEEPLDICLGSDDVSCPVRDDIGRALLLGRRLQQAGSLQGPDRVTLDDQALDALIRYRRARGLPGYPSPNEDQTPLIAKLTPKRIRRERALKTGEGVTAGYLNTELQRFFNYAAPVASRHHPEWAPILRQAASHWLRHTRGSHFALGHVSLAMTVEHLRHKDPRTTSKYYVHLDDEARGEAIDSISRLLDER